MMWRSSGRAPVRSSGSRTRTRVHVTSARPSWSGLSSATSTNAPCARARRSISADETSWNTRPGSDGPWRSVIARQPPGFSSVTNFRNARVRSVGATCIQTALSKITSNARPRRKTFSRPGKPSAIQRIAGTGCALCLGKHLARRIDGNDLKAPRHQPCCLSAAAASNIERKRRNLRERKRSASRASAPRPRPHSGAIARPPGPRTSDCVTHPEGEYADATAGAQTTTSAQIAEPAPDSPELRSNGGCQSSRCR